MTGVIPIFSHDSLLRIFSSLNLTTRNGQYDFVLYAFAFQTSLIHFYFLFKRLVYRYARIGLINAAYDFDFVFLDEILDFDRDFWPQIRIFSPLRPLSPEHGRDQYYSRNCRETRPNILSSETFS